MTQSDEEQLAAHTASATALRRALDTIRGVSGAVLVSIAGVDCSVSARDVVLFVREQLAMLDALADKLKFNMSAAKRKGAAHDAARSALVQADEEVSGE